jgi:diguanylate cyclase (GGDEF)-like protein
LIDTGFHSMIAPANNAPAAAIGYLCFSIALFGCAFAFWTRAKQSQGTLRVRWSLMAAGALATSLGLIPSYTEVVLHAGPARLLQTPCFNASEAFFLLAIVLFSAGATRSLVIVDMLQAALLVVLRFNLVYSPATRDHFTLNHLLVSQIMALFLFLAAVVACLGASSRDELKLLRILACFFGLRALVVFMADQVSYIWLHNVQCSLWDVPGTAFAWGFALYILTTNGSQEMAGENTEPLRSPSMIVRSLMPSFLALVNLMLGLFVLRISVPLAAVAMIASLVCYVMRTALLQAEISHEKALLVIRNEHLESLAIRDPLTGIGNRRSLAGVYGRLRASIGAESISILLMDIDRFKEANDCLGHLHGDKILIALAKMLENLTTGVPGSHCARLGGDEFALLLPGISHQEAPDLAEGLRMRFSARGFKAANGTATLSIGVASLLEVRDLPLESLISYADDALYRAKLLGRDRIEVQAVWERVTPAEDSETPALRVALQETGS